MTGFNMEKISNGSKKLVQLLGYPQSLNQEHNLSNIIDCVASNHSPMLIVDFSSPSIVYANKQMQYIYGITVPELLKNGIDLTYELIDPEYLALEHQAIATIMHYYHSFPENERNTYTYSFTLYQKNISGEYIWVQNDIHFLETDQEGKPVIALSKISDITTIKTDKDLHVVIGRYENGVFATKERKKISPDEPSLKLTLKETEILKMIAEGLTSKAIAEKLNISLFTVNKHRQNMLAKTKTRTITELIHMACNYDMI